MAARQAVERWLKEELEMSERLKKARELAIGRVDVEKNGRRQADRAEQRRDHEEIERLRNEVATAQAAVSQQERVATAVAGRVIVLEKELKEEKERGNALSATIAWLALGRSCG